MQDREFRRFAIYWLPDGALGRAGAVWLGWDAIAGREVPQQDAGRRALTDTPRRYGFHATVKAPFRLADGAGPGDLVAAARAVAATLDPVPLVLRPQAMGGRFVALAPDPQPQALTDLAAAVVRDLDPLRAPLTEAEIARRDPDRLPAPARAHLLRWGYPHVMELYRAHLTLTGEVDDATAAAAIAEWTALGLPEAVTLDSLSVAGEDARGRFHEVARLPLG